jgi:hypothetical protein
MGDPPGGRTTAAEAAELAALVRGREPQDVVDRLEDAAARLGRGAAPTPEDGALLAELRVRYGRELRELEHPDPW